MGTAGDEEPAMTQTTSITTLRDNLIAAGHSAKIDQSGTDNERIEVARGNALASIYWDDQDPQSAGWAYSLRTRTEHGEYEEVAGGGLDDLSEVASLLDRWA